jgi:hypothetical protein
MDGTCIIVWSRPWMLRSKSTTQQQDRNSGIGIGSHSFWICIMHIIEDCTMTVKCRTAIINALWFYYNFCPSVNLNILLCSFTFMHFLTNPPVIFVLLLLSINSTSCDLCTFTSFDKLYILWSLYFFERSKSTKITGCRVHRKK